MPADPGFALSLAVLVAAIYLVVLRLIDVNEREPSWGLALALGIGAVGAAVLAAIVDPDFRTLKDAGLALSAELTKFVAIAVLVAAFAAIASVRGWSEINGVADGVVYGAAVGLGFATGDAFARELSFTATLSDIAGNTGSWTILWTTVLAGLSEALFGAIIGAGVAIAIVGRGPRRLVAPVGALGAAFLLHWLYVAFARGNSLSGGQAAIRHWIALLLPVAIVAAMMVRALRREREAIAGELAGEAQRGIVTEAELRLLTSAPARQREYFKRLTRGDVDGWFALRSLQNRQVQLALTEARMRREPDGDRRRDLAAEVVALRESILAMKQRSVRGDALAAAEGAAP